MWIATNPLSYLASLNPLHSQTRARAEPHKSVTPVAVTVTDSDTSCSSTSASRRDSVDVEEPRRDGWSSIEVDQRDRERQRYDQRAQGFRVAEYPALRGKPSSPCSLQLDTDSTCPQTHATSTTRPPHRSPNPSSKHTPPNSPPQQRSTGTHTPIPHHQPAPRQPSTPRAPTSSSGCSTSIPVGRRKAGCSCSRAAPRRV